MTFLRRLRLRTRLAAGFGLVLAMLGVVVAIGVVALHHQSQSAERLRGLQQLMHQVDEQKYYDADISGWQVAYAWDVYRLGAARAVDPASDNRAGFLADAEKLRVLLADTRTDLMTDAERAQFDQLTDLWDRYFAADDRIVAAFRANQIEQGNALILGPGYDIYFQIVDTTDALIRSVSDRGTATAAQTQHSASVARTLMLVGLALAVLAALLLTVLLTAAWCVR